MQLLWLDIEGTGLDTSNDLLLELAVGFATLEKPFEIALKKEYVFGYSEQSLSRMGDFVREMHTKNGLLAEVAKSTLTLSTAEDELLTLVPAIEDWEEKPTLAGSSNKYDYEMLRTWMPKLHARLHYRLLDVSSVKLFFRAMGMARPPKIEAHRAWADVQESIAHARICAEWSKHRMLEQLNEPNFRANISSFFDHGEALPLDVIDSIEECLEENGGEG